VRLRYIDDRVRIDVPSGQRATLVVESGVGRWLRVRAGTETLGWARQAPHWAGLAWLARTALEPPRVVPPIRAREVGETSWPAYFARALGASSRSPLTAGTFELAPLHRLAPPHDGRDELTPGAGLGPFRATGMLAAIHLPATRLAWGHFTARTVLALRPPSPEDAARVKSWRKHARAGALPPALLWWVSALDAYLVIDGHDRLRAAELEQVLPSAVALYAVQETMPPPEVTAAAGERYRRAMESPERLADATARRASQQLIDAHAPWRHHLSTARFVPGLGEQFRREHPQLDALPADVAALFSE
jgi:hypothetical protein